MLRGPTSRSVRTVSPQCVGVRWFGERGHEPASAQRPSVWLRGTMFCNCIFFWTHVGELGRSTQANVTSSQHQDRQRRVKVESRARKRQFKVERRAHSVNKRKFPPHDFRGTRRRTSRGPFRRAHIASRKRRLRILSRATRCQGSACIHHSLSAQETWRALGRSAGSAGVKIGGAVKNLRGKPPQRRSTPTGGSRTRDDGLGEFVLGYGR